jgi:hypothetical protein
VKTEPGLIRVVLVLLCVAGAVAALVAYRSERRLTEIRQLGLVTVEQSDSPTERERARRRGLDLLPSARLLNPDSEVDVQRALYLEPQRGTELLEKLTDREPDNIYLWFIRVRKEEREGNVAAARRSYAHARALDPRLPPAP